ncbi:MAG: hypothetical protein IJM17_09555, partial [Firmicutes bacterium]|nr:hypothetical protein [Bacillota bacterium]
KEGPKDSRIASSELRSYQLAFGMYVAFCFPEMTRPQRNAYIKHNIPKRENQGFREARESRDCFRA